MSDFISQSTSDGIEVVHAAGCSDIEKTRRRDPLARISTGPAAGSHSQAIEDVYCDVMDDDILSDGDDPDDEDVRAAMRKFYAGSVVVKPCAIKAGFVMDVK